MKNILFLVSLLFIGVTYLQAQDENPYAKFGYEGKVLKTPQERQQYMLTIPNPDSSSDIALVGIAPNEGKYYLFDKDNELLDEDTLMNDELGKFLSVDPLTKSYPWYTPYQFAGNMPIWAIDLDGLEELRVTDLFETGFAEELKILREDDIFKTYIQSISKKELEATDLVIFKIDKATRQAATKWLTLSENGRENIKYYEQYPDAADKAAKDYTNKIAKKWMDATGLSREEVIDEIINGRDIHIVKFNPLEVLSKDLNWSINNFIHEILFHVVKNVNGIKREAVHQDHKEAFLYESLSEEDKKTVDTGGSPYPENLPKDSDGYKLYQRIKDIINKKGYKLDTSDEKDKTEKEWIRENF